MFFIHDKKFKENHNKAALTVTAVIKMVIIISVFGFLLDVSLLGLSYIFTTHKCAYIAKKLTAQGGFIGEGESGDPDSWITNTDIVKDLAENFRRVGCDKIRFHLYSFDDNISDLGANGIALYKDGYWNNTKDYKSPFVLMSGKHGLEYNEKTGSLGSFSVRYIYEWKFTPVTWIFHHTSPITIRNNYSCDYFRSDQEEF